jgi:hypothetical protein
MMKWMQTKGCVALLFGTAVLILLCGLALKWKGRSNLAAELERIRAAGEPLLPEDIDFRDPGEGLDRREWLVRFGEEFEDLYPPVLGDPSSLFWYDDHEASKDSEEVSLTEHERLFREAMKEGRTREELVAEIRSAQADPQVLANCSPFINCHFRTARTELGDAVPRALSIVDCAGFDLKAMTASAMDLDEDGMPSIFPVFPMSESFQVSDILRARHLQACLEGDKELAYKLLLAALDQADAYAWYGAVTQSMGWNILENRALDMLEDALYFLPMAEYLPELEQELEKARPMHFARQMCVTERAFGRRAYQWWKGLLGHRPSIFTVEGFAAKAFQEFDELAYLERMGRFIHEFDRSRPTWERHAALGRDGAMESPPSWSLMCNFLLPKLEQVISSTLDIDCRLTLARIALVCHRDGRDACLALAIATLDPFDGQPLRWREDNDGTILFWSVGADGVDDGGAHPQSDSEERTLDDITWRVKPR